VMSTLRKFSLRVGLRDEAHAPSPLEDGLRLAATLVFENGDAVTERSQTLEPPLLGGEAVLERGEACFELRITVLSSLCRGNKFCVLVAAADRPELRVRTGPMRTITKLYRTPVPSKRQKENRDAEMSPATGKAALPLEWPVAFFDEIEKGEVLSMTATCDAASGLPDKTKDELWAEVTTNGNRILELQKMQRDLFEQLRTLTCGFASLPHGD